MYNMPKSFLVKIICDEFDHRLIREYFKIKDTSPIELRLIEFPLAKLDDFIATNSSKEALGRIEQHAGDFPLRSAPTLYLLNSSSEIDFVSLIETSKKEAKRGIESATTFLAPKVIRCIYTKASAREGMNGVIELTLAYEKRIDYTECNIFDEFYAEKKEIYSLEYAVIWISKEKPKYIIVACCDFSALNPIMRHLSVAYNISSFLPNFTENMLKKLSEGADPKNATFSFLGTADDLLDVRTITVYDQDLGHRRLLSRITQQPGCNQRSGFFMNHPSLLRSGLGISCQYGRIWTPAHLSRVELVGLATSCINHLDSELSQASDADLADIVSYYSNAPVEINKHLLKGSTKKLFIRLVHLLINASRNNFGVLHVDRELLTNLIKESDNLGFNLSIGYDCDNCGLSILRCRNCGFELAPVISDDKISLKCPHCKLEFTQEKYECECGVEISIVDVVAMANLFPEPSLVQAIEVFIKRFPYHIHLPAYFMIISGQMMSLSRGANSSLSRRINLEDLKLWDVRGRINHEVEISDCATSYTEKALEKCKLYHNPPKKEDCQECQKRGSNFTFSDFEKPNICLLRTFGLPISIPFDGIHHGHEGADLIYTDEFDGIELKIHIHVKSYSKKKNGLKLGRSVEKIKGLYTQLFYSLYNNKNQRQEEQFNTLGVAIPNSISDDVLESMEYLVTKLGYNFIAIQRNEWEKIAQRAIEATEF